MRVSRSAVYVNVAITRSTRFVVSAGSRVGVVRQVKLTRFDLPNAKRENHRAISTSKPAFLPVTSMYPNGGESHLTPMFQRPRDFTSGGSGGSAFAAALPVAAVAATCVLPVGWAALHVATSAATSETPARARTIRFIQPLLLRRFPTPRGSRQARASAAGTGASAPPWAGRERRPACPAPQCDLLPQERARRRLLARTASRASRPASSSRTGRDRASRS